MIYGSIEFLATNAGTYTIDLNGNEVELRRSANTFLIGEDATITDIAGGGTLTLNGNRQFNFTDSSKTLSISAVIAGGGGTYTLATGGTLDLSGVNTFTSALTLNNQSQLVISGAGQLGSGSYAGNITMNQGTDFTYASSADQTLSGVISDDGTGNGSNDVNVSGSGTLTLTGTNTYTGRTNISTTLEIQNSEALGTGLVVLTGGGELQFGADTLDLSENVLIQNSGDNRTIRLDLAGTNTGTLSGQLDIRRNGAQLFDIDVGADDTLSVTSVIIGAGSAGLTKEGDGTLIIEANSEYTGATTVNGGTLEISATALGNSPDSASYQINNGSTLFLNETTATNLILAVGIGDITFGSSDPGGTLQLNGNTIFRNQTITTTGGARNFITGERFNMQNTRNITFDTAVGTDGDGIDLEVSASTDSGDIIKNGAGTVSLTNSANNLGLQGGATGDPNTVTINAGTLEVAGAGRLQSGSYAGAITNSGIFKYNSTADQTLSGVISGAGSLEKDNTGTLTLSGTNDYTGNTTVSAGILEVLTNSALGTAAGGTVVESGATLRLNNGANIASEALTLSGTLDGRTNGGDVEYGGAITLAANAEFFAGGSNTMTISGNVDGAGNQLTLNHAVPTISITGNITGTNTSLVKQGTGTTILSGTNNYNGDTTVSAGTLQAGSTQAFGVNSDTAVVGGATLVLDGNSNTIGNLNDAGTVENANVAAATLTVGGGDATGGVFSGTIQDGAGGGALSLTKTGTGTQTLSGTNTYTGATTVSGGTLQLSGSLSGFSAITVDGPSSKLTLAPGSALAFNDVTIQNGGTVDSTTSGALHGVGELAFVNGGSLSASAGTPGFLGHYDLAGDVTVSGNGLALIDAGKVFMTTTNPKLFTVADDTAGTDLRVTSELNGVGITKLGLGTMELTGTSIYTGATTVSAGTLSLGGSGATLGGSIASSSLTTVASGATLSGSGTTGNLTIAEGGFHNPGQSPGITVVAGNYIENGTLQIELLNHTGGAGSGYDQVQVSGDVFISQTGSSATLDVVYDSAGGGGTFTPTFGQEFIIIRNDGGSAVNGTFDLATGDSAPVGSGGPGTTYTVDGDTLVLFYDGGDGNDVVLVSASGTGLTELFVDDQFTSPSGVDGNQEAGTGNQQAWVGVNAFATTDDAFDSLSSTFNGTLTLNGNSTTYDVDLNHANAGGVTVNLVADSDETANDVTIGTLTGSTGDSIVVNSEGNSDGNLIVEDGDFGGIISGAGTLTKTTVGTLVLTGANTYSGATAIDGGTLQLGNGGSDGSLNTASSITIGAGATFEVNQDDTVTQGTDFSTAGLSGDGSFVQAGSGTTILNAANSYTGTTTVEAGTLLVNGDNSGATGAVTVDSGATLGGDGTVGGDTTIAAGGFLAPGDGTTPIGDLSFSGNLNLASISSGALQFDLGAPGTSDTVLLTDAGSALNIGASLDFSDFDFNLAAGFPPFDPVGGPHSYTLFDTASTILGSFGDQWQQIGGWWGRISFANGATTNSDIILELQNLPFADDPSVNFFDFIPEPSRAMLLLFGFSAAVLRRRRPV